VGTRRDEVVLPVGCSECSINASRPRSHAVVPRRQVRPIGQHPVHRQPGRVEFTSGRREGHEMQAGRPARARVLRWVRVVSPPGQRVIDGVESYRLEYRR
jgi:hypothetical protein